MTLVVVAPSALRLTFIPVIITYRGKQLVIIGPSVSKIGDEQHGLVSHQFGRASGGWCKLRLKFAAETSISVFLRS